MTDIVKMIKEEGRKYEVTDPRYQVLLALYERITEHMNDREHERQLVKSLLGYNTEHKSWCRSTFGSHDPCDCGYEETLDEIRRVFLH